MSRRHFWAWEVLRQAIRLVNYCLTPHACRKSHHLACGKTLSGWVPKFQNKAEKPGASKRYEVDA